MWNTDNKYVITGSPATKELDLFHLVVAPTFACNLRCKHCYLPDHSSRSMPRTRLQEIIQEWHTIVLRERGCWGGVFHLKGGEPTTMKYFSEILEEVERTQALRIIITTNALTWPSRALLPLVRMVEAKQDSVIVTVSVDGGDPRSHDALRGVGTWEKTWSTIGLLRSEGVPVHLNFVLTRSNRDSLRNLLSMAQEQDITQVNILPFVRRGYGKDLAEEWLSAVERHKFLSDLIDSIDLSQRALLTGTLPDLLSNDKNCLSECVVGYAGLYYILPDGSVYSCPNLAHSDFVAGHLDDMTLDSIHSNMKSGELYQRIPGYGVESLDVSCKGAVIGELRSGQQEEARSSMELASQLISIRGEVGEKRPFSACFSRNI